MKFDMTEHCPHRLPAEWEAQGFIQLTWPHEGTDWLPYLQEAQHCFLQVAKEIVKREDLLIVAPDTTKVKKQLILAGILNNDTRYLRGETGALSFSVDKHHIVLYECPTNDTWARDHAFITTTGGNGPVLNDFCFNGWGQKFAADKDNAINECLLRDRIICKSDGAASEKESKRSQLSLSRVAKEEEQSSTDNHSIPLYSDRRKTVLEGGSIESNGKGILLSTASCLLAPNRNGFNLKEEAEDMLRQTFDAKQVHLLEHGYLPGDDTDGHIDTLARLCPDDTIVYVKSTDKNDAAHDELQKMEEELHALRTPEGKAFRLVPLPTPSPMHDDDGSLLPATYANFLILNGAVLMPTYREPETDRLALKILHTVFPDREIIGVDCSVLVRQHGSLHCITMQYPSCVSLAL